MPLAKIADLNNPEAPHLIGLAKKLSTMYDDFLDNFPNDAHERAPGIHASDINSCVRRSVYCLTKIERRQQISRHWQKRFQTGHAIHGMVQSQMKRMAIVENAKRQAETLAYDNGWHLSFEDEVKVSPKHQKLAEYYQLHSSCDGVFSFRHNPGEEPFLRIGLEIKTESPDGFAGLRAPKSYHVQQMHLYMAALDLPLAWFFYFNKGNQNNTGSEAPWLITFDPAVWKRLELRIHSALEAEKTGQLPPREEGVHCEFCPWSWTCEPKHTNQDRPTRSYTNPFKR